MTLWKFLKKTIWDSERTRIIINEHNLGKNEWTEVYREFGLHEDKITMKSLEGRISNIHVFDGQIEITVETM